MKPFYEMHRKVTSSSHYQKMLRFVAPLKDQFGIQHFWYYQISFSGDYTYIGTHSAWNEYCFEHDMHSLFPCLRHPSTLKGGIHLMKASDDENYKTVLETAWKKFHINFGINLQNHTPNGIEAFGFATCYNDHQADERLLNDLPFLRHFIKIFRERHQKLFHLIEDHQVNLPSLFGTLYYEQPKTLLLPRNREALLRKWGFESILSLTKRETSIAKYLAHGYPAAFIAYQLQLSKRTVENYIATIKSKLSCRTKVELIQKCQDIVSTGYFD